MEKTIKRSINFPLKDYFLLTKPGIIFGNSITAASGFALGSVKQFDLPLFLMMLLGLSWVIAAACIFNNYIDKELDAKMPRTQNRALVKGTISPQNALFLGLLLTFLGFFTLYIFVTSLAALTAFLGLLVYVFVYSYSKYKTPLCTLLGSIAGSTPPLVGYAAASGKIDLGAWLLFLLVALWQMPHFFAIAIFRLEDYAKGNIPILPLQKGMLKTKGQMALYITLFILAIWSLYLTGYSKLVFPLILTPFGLIWLLLCRQGFKGSSDTLWARKMFIFSLIVIMAFGLTSPFS